jgi:ABC-type multidrug transport system fused ATPase/permease subunit
LRRPRLLLLDEATSQLDAASEAAMREVIGELAEEMAVLAVAHRLSTIRDAAIIAIVRDGQVLDSGTHQDLQVRGGLYPELIRHQMLTGPEVLSGRAAIAT